MEENGKVLLDTAYATIELEAQLNKMITQEETKKMIADAIKESKNYVDIINRSNARQRRREEKILSTVYRRGFVGLVLFVLSAILLYLCEGTYYAEMQTPVTKVLFVVSIVGLVISSLILLTAFIKHDNFYRTKYTVSYRICENKGRGLKLYAYEYKTKSTSPEKAIKRFYKIYGDDENLDKFSVRMTDEFGTKYNRKGKIAA